jgi:alkylhydroperoxidase/carboxymuconolactone decarboxylase family protein YurZ
MQDNELPGTSKETWTYAEEYFKDAEVIDSFRLLAKYRPEVFEGYMALRQAAFNQGPDAALTPREKELIILAIDIARWKTNPPPLGHAKRAIEYGATPHQVAEVVSLCLMIGGMLTYRETGMFALAAAQEHYEKLQGKHEEQT